jgi:hypothetical protein
VQTKKERKKERKILKHEGSRISEKVFQKYLNWSIIFLKCVIGHFAIKTDVFRLKPVVSREIIESVDTFFLRI